VVLVDVSATVDAPAMLEITVRVWTVPLLLEEEDAV
jgi:hypothetical protein